MGGLPTSPTPGPLVVYIITLHKLEAKASLATCKFCWSSCSVHNLFKCSRATCSLVQVAPSSKVSLISLRTIAIPPSDREPLKSLETGRGCWRLARMPASFWAQTITHRRRADSDPPLKLTPNISGQVTFFFPAASGLSGAQLSNERGPGFSLSRLISHQALSPPSWQLPLWLWREWVSSFLGMRVKTGSTGVGVMPNGSSR